VIPVRIDGGQVVRPQRLPGLLEGDEEPGRLLVTTGFTQRNSFGLEARHHQQRPGKVMPTTWWWLVYGELCYW